MNEEQSQVWNKIRSKSIAGRTTHIYTRVMQLKDIDGNIIGCIDIVRHSLIPLEVAQKMNLMRSERVFNGFVVAVENFPMKISTLWMIMGEITIKDLGVDFKVSDSPITPTA